MKVFLNYQDHAESSKHKTLKITLPKSWKAGPTSKLLDQFVESYNKGKAETDDDDDAKLDSEQLHFELKAGKIRRVEIASDDVIAEVLEDRQDIFVMHGPSKMRSDLGPLPLLPKHTDTETASTDAEKSNGSTVSGSDSTVNKKDLAACTHFGCKNRFPKGGPYPQNCVYHKSPPIFHETAKYWSCCPQKKAYDWDEFQAIPGCQTGVCTDQKDDETKVFLGGCDVRDAMNDNAAPPLKSIDDFNKGTIDHLSSLRTACSDVGVENELFDQVIEGMKANLRNEHGEGVSNEADLLLAVERELGDKMKAAFKDIAVQQLRLS
jgi:hypothetical protein